MTDIEAKALELWGPGIAAEVNIHNFAILGSAFIEMRDRHEAYKQKVSDIVKAYVNGAGKNGGIDEWVNLKSLIIPKPNPDPLVDVLDAMKDGRAGPTTESYAACLRAALEAHGLEIREKGQ